MPVLQTYITNQVFSRAIQYDGTGKNQIQAFVANLELSNSYDAFRLKSDPESEYIYTLPENADPNDYDIFLFFNYHTYWLPVGGYVGIAPIPVDGYPNQFVDTIFFAANESELLETRSVYPPV